MYQTTSDYLEEIVDFDQPILAVGPGIDYWSLDKGFMPMDRAIIWFAEQLHGQNGRLDILDQKPENSGHVLTDINEVKKYMDRLGKRTNLGEIRYITSKIESAKLPREEYGLIWDHGTLEEWIFWDYERVLNSYKQSIKHNGKIVICSNNQPGCLNFLKREEFTLIRVKEDKYATSLSEKLVVTRPTNHDVISDGFIIPEYFFRTITEIKK